MSFLFAKDKRTSEQVMNDYSFGRRNARVIFEALSYDKFWIEDTDRLGENNIYHPDCFIKIKSWYPVEIKYTETELDYVELKENQCKKLAKIGGLYLQSTPTRFIIVSAKSIMECGKLVTDTYCNKPCYRFRPNQWEDWKKELKPYKK
jgi:hypothetical protein